MTVKQALRARLRRARREHVAALPDSTRALLFRRPPGIITGMIPPGATIGLYCAHAAEAPADAYVRFFHEAGHPVALPWFADRASQMGFRAHTDPYGLTDIQLGPFGMGQPRAKAPVLVPQFLFVPLLGFTADGRRLGQGGGHYDRWMAAHTSVPAIGLAWDCQLVDDLQSEPHDHPMAAVITPTRLFGPF